MPRRRPQFHGYKQGEPGKGIATLKPKNYPRVDMVANVSIAIETGNTERLQALLVDCEQLGYERIAERIRKAMR